MISLPRVLILSGLGLVAGCAQAHDNVDAATDAIVVPVDACMRTGHGDCVDCAPVTRRLTAAEVLGARWTPEDCGDLERLCYAVLPAVCGCRATAPGEGASGVGRCSVITDASGTATALECTVFTCLAR